MANKKLCKTSPFRPWIWCILLQIFISFPGIACLCLGVNIGISVYPKGDIYIRHGSPLEMFCINENNNSTADDIKFTLSDNVLHSDKVNETSIRLFIDKPEKQLNTYYCKNTKNDKICPLRVIVEEPPQDVTNFSCWSKNLEALYCNWTSPLSKIKCNYNVTLVVNNRKLTPSIAEKTNVMINNQEVWSCMWNASTTPSYRQQLDYYVFLLQSCNYFGCNTQKIVINHFSIVKPDPPQLEVFVTGPHTVLLKWNISYNIHDFVECGVDFKIEYQIEKIDNKTQFHLVDTSGLPSNDLSYAYELTLPYAYTKYEVRIYVKTKEAGENFWSQFNYKFFTTSSELPARPPNMIAGSFTQAVYMYKREIYVYWKQLEYYEVAGPNFTYKVVVTQNNDVKTIYSDKGSLSYVTIDNASLESINVKVWSHNVNGSSLNFSQLYIPPKSDTQGFQLNSFTQVANKNGTYELSWDNLLHIDNYSLFWCEHITPKICSGPMSYKVLSSDINNHIIHLPSGYRYQFAISANNGTSTSGMIWAICDIAKEGIKLYNFPVKIEHNRFGQTYVELRWSLNCALKDKIITGYNITYCPIIEDSTLCDIGVGNSSVYIDDPKQLSKNITNLLPFRTYQFSISLDTTSGLKSVENNTHSVTTLEDAPSKPRNVHISNVTYNSLIISWDPPLHENGKIHEHVIYTFYNGTNTLKKTKTYPMMNENKKNKRILEINDLESFTNYSFIVKACNINENPKYCSEDSPKDSILLTTAIGPPHKITSPSTTNNPEGIEWNPPITSGKPVDGYQILRIRNGNEMDIINVSSTKYTTKHCDDVKEVTYQVRGINFDEHPNHGVETTSQNVTLPMRRTKYDEYPGEWSDKTTVKCNGPDGMTIVYIIMILFFIVGMGYGSYRLYKKYRKIQDIKPALPVGLGIPEKEISKYPFISSKDEKPSSDEMLLLPNQNTNSTSTPALKKEDSVNCGVSDHTNSTALSDNSRKSCLIDRQESTSDESTNSSLQSEEETVKEKDCNDLENDNNSKINNETLPKTSPYLNDNVLNKKPTNGYVQPSNNLIPIAPKSEPLQSTSSGYVRNVPQNPAVTAPGSTYVLAGLAPTLNPTTSRALNATTLAPLSTGYVRPEEVQTKPAMNFPKLFEPEHLPILPTLPICTKQESDNSYIQLQSLDNIPSLKPTVRNIVPSKPSTTSNGYVSPGDAVITKHLNNMLTVSQPTEESTILDPTMSPDAYCRFSWSNHPTNDNLHSILSDSPTTETHN